MEPFSTLRSKTLVLPGADIDTDQIIPARFLTTVSREGLGEYAFADWRYGDDGQPREHVLNDCDPAEHRVLVAGHNFGCGSSREHAPWALLDYGFRAVVSTGIADIFTANALKNGLLPVTVDAATHRWLIEHPGAEVEIDLDRCALVLPDGRKVGFPVEAFARYCLLRGVDQLGYLLGKEEAIARYEAEQASASGV